MKCISCGSTNMLEGVVPITPKDELKFYPGQRTFVDRVFGHGRRVRAYGCLHCHHLQFTVAFEPSDLNRHQNFEGSQPTLTERLEAAPDRPNEP